MANKKTNKDFFAEVIALAGENAELAAWAQKQIETLDRKTANRKPTKTQEANEAIKAEILEVMADGVARTVTEIMSAVPSLADASNQKAASLVRQLKDSGALVREEIKRKAYFKVA